MNKRSLLPFLSLPMALGMNLPEIKLPTRSKNKNSEYYNLPEGFRVWMFDRNNGQLIDLEWREKNDIERVDIFEVVSRSKENARKEFNRLTKRG